MFGCGTKPFGSEGIIELGAIAVIIHEAKIALADRITGLRSGLIQFQGVDGISGNAESAIVKKCEIVGGRCVSLGSRRLVVLDGFTEIAVRAFPVLIEIA